MTPGGAAIWIRSPWRWLAIGTLGAAVCAGAYVLRPAAMLHSYWLALLTWTGLSVGALGVLAIYGLVGGRWGELLAPPLAVAARPLWLMAVLFVPVVWQLPILFPWAQAPHSSLAEPTKPEAIYFGGSWFVIRAASYWALWLLLSILLPPYAVSAASNRPSSRLSAAALPLIVLGVTFASIDWMMSLEAHWYSTAYGVLILAGQAAAAFAFAIVVAAIMLVEDHEARVDGWPWLDAGNLLMAAVCFWMYIAFSQFLIVWSGNLPEEIPWYLTRARQPWRAVAVVLVGLHFVVPFVLLLSRDLKQRPRALAAVAGLVLVMHAVDLWWLIAPAFDHSTLLSFGCDFLALLSVGALWMFAFALRPPQWEMRATPLPSDEGGLPQTDQVKL